MRGAEGERDLVDSGMMMDSSHQEGFSHEQAMLTGISFDEHTSGPVKTARTRSATTPHTAMDMAGDENDPIMVGNIKGRKQLVTGRQRSRTSLGGHQAYRSHPKRHASPPLPINQGYAGQDHEGDDFDMIEQLDSPCRPGMDPHSLTHSRTSSMSRSTRATSEPPFTIASAIVSENGSPMSRKKSSLPLKLDGSADTREEISLNSPDLEQSGFPPRSPSEPLLPAPRPLFLRKFTDPTGSRPGTPVGMSFPVIEESANKKATWRKSFHSGQDLSRMMDRVSTPVQSFEMERPSPAAFMSTGLVKKGSGYLKHSALSGPSSAPGMGPSSLALQSDFSRTPDTPIKAYAGKPIKALDMPAAKMKIHPLRFGEATAPVQKPLSTAMSRSISADSAGTSPPANAGPTIPTGGGLGTRSRGLRRKGSRMWQRTDSGNFSNSTIGDGFSLEEEPETPTRPDNAGGEFGPYLSFIDAQLY